jgi:hypothetical protein
VLQAFIDKYPSSFYVELAKAKIEELKQKQEDTERESIVRSVQRALKDTDCYDGAIDGVWSRSAQEALARFARLAKLEPAPTEPARQRSMHSMDGRVAIARSKRQLYPVMKKLLLSHASARPPRLPKLLPNPLVPTARCKADRRRVTWKRKKKRRKDRNQKGLITRSIARPPLHVPGLKMVGTDSKLRRYPGQATSTRKAGRPGVRKWSLQTELQTNYAARHGTGHY